MHRGVKENLVLERNPGMNEFAFIIDAPGLVPGAAQGNTMEFYDEQTGDLAVTLTQPWAMDSRRASEDTADTSTACATQAAAGMQTADETSATALDSAAGPVEDEAQPASEGPNLCLDLGYRVEPAGEGKYRLTMYIDPEFLEAPSTVYPVTIVPSATVGANDIPYVTLFSDGSRWTNLGFVGNASDKEAIMYFKMPNMYQYKYINPNRVSAASVTMTQRVGSEKSYEVGLHDSNTSVSISSATYSTIFNNLGTRISTKYCSANDIRYTWDFKTLFSTWLGYELNGEGWNSYQFIIKARNTGMDCKYFDTSNDENCFYITIIYNEDTAISDGYYYIRGAKASRYLDHQMSENRTTAWSLDGTPNQRWKVTKNSDGTYGIRPADNLSLGLEVYCAADTNQQPITQYNYDSSNYYKWRIIQNGDGSYRIMPVISKTKGLDVHNGTDTTMTFNGRSFPKRNGIDVQLYNYSGGSHQKWFFVSTSNAVTGVHMSNLAGTSTLFFNTVSSLGTNLGGAPCVKLTDSSATDVCKLMQSSGIFLFNGHGAPTYVICGGGSSNLTRDYVLSQPSGSLNNCRLVVYNACQAASGGVGAANLAQATVDRGATTVVGFRENILVNQADTWMTAFCNGIAAGDLVEEAKNAALQYVKNEYGVNNVGYTDTAVVFGNSLQTLNGTVK